MEYFDNFSLTDWYPEDLAIGRQMSDFFLPKAETRQKIKKKKKK